MDIWHRTDKGNEDEGEVSKDDDDEDDEDDEDADDDDDDEGADDERQHVCSDLTLFHAAQRVEDQIALTGHLLIIQNYYHYK